MNEEKKIEIVKQFLNRYGDQKVKVEWQKKKLDGMVELLNKDENPDEVKEIRHRCAVENATLCKLYKEITDALDMIQMQDQRDILYDVYIELMTIDNAASKNLIHPKTAGRRHRMALIELYDILNP